MYQLRTRLLCAAVVVAAFSVQQASAADLEPVPAAPFASRWDGAYASFSAGGSWTRANEQFTDANSSMSVDNFLAPVFTPETITTTTTSNTVVNQAGQIAGAVFTLAMGYNVVWNAWLAGVQSETSFNINKVRTQGVGVTTASQTIVDTLFGSSSSTSSSSATNFNFLQNKWTISEMARLGYLAAPDLLVYGLAGWSWGGFEWGTGPTPFVMNGPTWGAGVEKDFGWIRAFVQYKGISYLNKTVDFSNPNSNQATASIGGVLAETFSSTVADSAVRHFSANVNQVTAGITIPFFQTR